jgi:hypothetical protein
MHCARGDPNDGERLCYVMLLKFPTPSLAGVARISPVEVQLGF